MTIELKAALYVVPTPIGNLADLTRRAADVLAAVPWIAAEDTRHSGPLLKQLGATGRLLPAHQHNEQAAAQRIVDIVRAGEAVALISDAGTPGISDPGARVVAAMHAAGLPVVPLPGACAAVTALSAAGFLAEQFLFHGFLPSKSGQRRQVLAGLTENDAQNKKETLEASEAGEAAISRRAARINELTAYLALIEETRHEMQ